MTSHLRSNFVGTSNPVRFRVATVNAGSTYGATTGVYTAFDSGLAGFLAPLLTVPVPPLALTLWIVVAAGALGVAAGVRRTPYRR